MNAIVPNLELSSYFIRSWDSLTFSIWSKNS